MEQPPADQLGVAGEQPEVVDQPTETALVQRRGNVSVARWIPEIGMAEVLVRRGKLWGGMGVIRNSTLYCHIEEAVYMVEQGSLLLLQGEAPYTDPDVYNLLLVPSNGCSWDMYQVFCHLKRLGYVVGRHNIAWSTSSKRRPLETSENREERTIRREEGEEKSKNNATVSEAVDEGRPGSHDNDDLSDDKTSSRGGARYRFSGADILEGSGHVSIWSRLFASLNFWKPNQEVSKLKDEETEKERQHCSFDIKFDVYQPNSRFRKTLPGCPIFNLCIVIGKPPLEQCKMRALRLQIERRPPVKFASIISGHVFMFSFTPITLPTLP